MRETTHLAGARTAVNEIDRLNIQVPMYMQVGDVLEGQPVHKIIERISIHSHLEGKGKIMERMGSWKRKNRKKCIGSLSRQDYLGSYAGDPKSRPCVYRLN